MKQLILLYALLSICGCSKKQTVLTPIPDAVTSTAPSNVPALEFGQEKPAVIITKPVEINETIYFDLNRAEIRANQVPTLDAIVLKANKAPSRALHLKGGCCPLGTEQYNDALGFRRARAVSVYLAQRTKNPIEAETVGEHELVTELEDEIYLNRRCEVTLE